MSEHAAAGEGNSALKYAFGDQLSILLTTPAHFSAQLLRLDPRWEPIRHHPRYRELIEPDPSP
jgi:hypothetical protein